MTNHKIKDYHKNRLAFEVIVKNYEMLCSLLIVLNKKYPKTFYPKKCRQWIDDFADNCKIANEWDKDGVYAYKMQRACENSGIDDYIEECTVGQVDIRKFRVKDKVRTTLQEQKEALAGLEAFRRWSAENVKKEGQ